MRVAEVGGLPARARSRRGVTFIEMAVTALVLAFIVAATAGLYNIGQRQQLIGGRYSANQTNMREALRRMTRALRHGYAVVGTSSAGSLSGISSGAGQVVVRVPDPGGATQSDLLFYRSPAGAIYYLGQNDPAPGTKLLDNVQSLTFNYFQTTPSGTTVVDATPSQATEVMITMTAVSRPATTTVTAYVNLRNAIGGF